MKKTRNARRMRKMLVLVSAIALVFGIAIGGTVAWLADSTQEVTNTFTPSNIDIELSEPSGVTVTPNYEFEMVPGDDIEKDANVVVKAGSEASIVFVKITESDNYDDFLNAYVVDSEWTKLEENGNVAVYYRLVDETTADTLAMDILDGNKVTVSEAVTTDDMRTLKTAGKADYPTLTFEAFAIQQLGFIEEDMTSEEEKTAAAAAWDKVEEQTWVTEETNKGANKQ